MNRLFLSLIAALVAITTAFVRTSGGPVPVPDPLSPSQGAEMPDGPDAPGPGETHHSNTGEPDPSRDVLIDPAPLTDAEQALFDAYIAQNRPYATEQDYLGRLRNGAVVYSVYPCEASEGYPQNESIGPALFYKEHINNSLFFIDGKGVRSLSGAYRSGLVSDDEILALRDAFYRDDPDLAELYHPVFAAEKIRELFLSDDLYLHLVPGHLPEHISDAPDEEENMAELPALPVSMSESWDGSRAASLATGDLASRGGRTIIPGDRIIVTSPAHEGYAVHAYFSFRKNALYRTLVLETPYGDNVLSGSSADALYVYLLEQYRILAEQAGITTDPGPDPVAQIDLDRDGYEERIVVRDVDGEPHLQVLNMGNVSLFDTVLGNASSFKASACILFDGEEGPELLVYSPVVSRLGHGILFSTISFIEETLNTYLEKYHQADWEMFAQYLLVDEENLQSYLDFGREAFGRGQLLAAVTEDGLVLGTEEGAPDPDSLFLGLRPFYDCFSELYPELPDERIPLGERLERLKDLYREDYEKAHVAYTVTSPYDSGIALIQTGNYTAGSYGQKGLLPWIDADLTEWGPFAIRSDYWPDYIPVEERDRYDLELFCRYNIYSAEGRMTALKEEKATEDGMTVLRWPDARYGKRYYVECLYGKDPYDRVVFGVICREGKDLVSRILDAYNGKFGTEYEFAGDGEGPDVYFFGKYGDGYALRITGVPEDREIWSEEVLGYRFVYPGTDRLLLYMDDVLYTLEEAAGAEETAAWLAGHIRAIHEDYYSDDDGTGMLPGTVLSMLMFTGMTFTLGRDDNRLSWLEDRTAGTSEAIEVRVSNRIRGLYERILGSETVPEDGDGISVPPGSDAALLLQTANGNYSMLLFPDGTSVLSMIREQVVSRRPFLCGPDAFPFLYRVYLEAAGQAQ